jgi:hypothetical protein
VGYNFIDVAVVLAAFIVRAIALIPDYKQQQSRRQQASCNRLEKLNIIQVPTYLYLEKASE